MDGQGTLIWPNEGTVFLGTFEKGQRKDGKVVTIDKLNEAVFAEEQEE